MTQRVRCSVPGCNYVVGAHESKWTVCKKHLHDPTHCRCAVCTGKRPRQLRRGDVERPVTLPSMPKLKTYKEDERIIVRL